MKPLAVLFDLDGTLLDTLRDIADALNDALRALGFPTHPADAYRRFVGDGVTVLARRALPTRARDDETAARVVEGFAASYGRRWRDHTVRYAGVDAMLDGLFERGLGVAIVSNKPDSFTQLTVEALLDAWSFHHVRGVEGGAARKPDPTPALEAAKALDVPPAACLFVGDTSTDMETGRRAGMLPVGVLWGFRDADELRRAGARHLLAEPVELLRLVDGLDADGPGRRASSSR